MSRAKVKPTQLTRRSSRQGSIPKGREEQGSRKRAAKISRHGVPAPKSRGAKRARHGNRARTPSMG
jgi:hypothetical protein